MQQLPWNTDPSDEEYAEWRRNWQSMEHRLVPDVSGLDLACIGNPDFGAIVSASISLVPEKYVPGIFFSSDNCLLCRRSTVAMDRLAANFHPIFITINGISYGV